MNITGDPLRFSDIAICIATRFPLLTQLSLQEFGGDKKSEVLPLFLGLFHAVMDARHRAPVCFILPRKGEICRIASVLYASHRFMVNQQQLSQKYGESSFRYGDYVRIHPSRHVYRYGGFCKDQPEMIWLETSDGRRTMPAQEVLPRLEKTTLRRPIGRLHSPIQSPEPAIVDLLFGTTTFGNQSLAQNEVILIDAVNGFSDFIDSYSFQLRTNSVLQVPVRKLLPFGELSANGATDRPSLQKWSDRNPMGEPLIAVTPSALLCADYCIDSTSFSKLIVVNGLSRLRQLQAYDDIVQTQHLVLFADDEDVEMCELLRERGCKFWVIEEDELTMDPTSTHVAHKGIVGQVVGWCSNESKLEISPIGCTCNVLEQAFIHLSALTNIVDTDEGGLRTKVISHAWRMFNDLCAKFHSLDQEYREHASQKLSLLRAEIVKGSVWFTKEAVGTLLSFADSLQAALAPGSELGVSKEMALRQLLSESISLKHSCLILGRSESELQDAQSWLNANGYGGRIGVSSVRSLPERDFCNQLICASWLGTDTMKRVARSLVSSRITILAYPFEKLWLEQCRRRLSVRPQVTRVTGEEKSAFVGGTTGLPLSWPVSGFTQETIQAAKTTEPDIWRFEYQLRSARKGTAASSHITADSVMAYYVSFLGDSYTYLMESHRVVIATGLLSGGVKTGQRLPEQVVADIRHGDLAVFPESGERELVAEKADQILGEKAQDLRHHSRLWRAALCGSGLRPDQFALQAKELGRPRHIVTIRNWFSDNNQIGPGVGDMELESDLTLIALVTGNEVLERSIPSVIAAIKELRSAHLSAGVKIRDILWERLPSAVSTIEESGTKIDLGELGSAWIVQVDSRADAAEIRDRSEVNRLLWDQSLDFKGDLF